MSSKKKQLIGIVVSDKMEKTVVVAVETLRKHPLYKKRIRSTKKYKAHNDLGAKEGNKVKIIETRPLSKHKKWRVMEVIN